MIANYHTHTPRCRHAVGAEEEYIRAAIDGGLQVLGFSDHTPYWFGSDYYSTMRMFPDQLEDYVNTVRSLQVRYADRLQLLLGLEAEYYPALFPELIPRLQDAGIEYLLLGQHWLGNEMGEPYNGRPTENEKHLQRYCDQVIEAMETGLFTYLAHPDLIFFVGERPVYERHMRRLCKAAKSCDIPLEINFLGMREGRNYPDMRLWPLAAEEGCKVIFGCDAHRPEHTVQPAMEKQALQMVRTYGLNLLDTVPLRKI